MKNVTALEALANVPQISHPVRTVSIADDKGNKATVYLLDDSVSPEEVKELLEGNGVCENYDFFETPVWFLFAGVYFYQNKEGCYTLEYSNQIFESEKIEDMLAECLKASGLNYVLISSEFSNEIEHALTSEELKSVNAENALRNDDTCATHDYIDAIMLMCKAFGEIMGSGVLEITNENHLALIGKAWKLSKAFKFQN